MRVLTVFVPFHSEDPVAMRRAFRNLRNYEFVRMAPTSCFGDWMLSLVVLDCERREYAGRNGLTLGHPVYQGLPIYN